jgi:hypothetical protein
MKIRLDRSRGQTLLQQARDQIISGPHAGLLRKGSGAFVTVRGQDEFEPAQAVSLARLLRRHLDEASGMNVSPLAYTALVHRLVTRASLRGQSVAAPLAVRLPLSGDRSRPA